MYTFAPVCLLEISYEIGFLYHYDVPANNRLTKLILTHILVDNYIRKYANFPCLTTVHFHNKLPIHICPQWLWALYIVWRFPLSPIPFKIHYCNIYPIFKTK